MVQEFKNHREHCFTGDSVLSMRIKVDQEHMTLEYCVILQQFHTACVW